MHAHQLVQGKLDGGSEARRRQNRSVVDPGLGDAEPRAVLERELEEVGLGPRIADQLRVEAERDDPRAIDFDGLARHLDLDLALIQAEEPAGEPVAVGQPDHFGRAWLGAHLLPESVELVGLDVWPAKIKPRMLSRGTDSLPSTSDWISRLVSVDDSIDTRMMRSPSGRITCEASSAGAAHRELASQLDQRGRAAARAAAPVGRHQLDRAGPERDQPSRDRLSIDQERLEDRIG